jgi:molybdopterin biosynthesis enzyme
MKIYKKQKILREPFLACFPANTKNDKIFTKRGIDAKQGDVLIEKNKKINENDVAIAASCGYSRLKVKRKLRFLVVNTGNELVATAVQPKNHQIRMSNGILLETMIRKWGGISACVQVNDHVESLQKIIRDWEKKSRCNPFYGRCFHGAIGFYS